MIRKSGNRWQVVSKEAEAQLAAVEAGKHPKQRGKRKLCATIMKGLLRHERTGAARYRNFGNR